jgi:hypothetical protein
VGGADHYDIWVDDLSTGQSQVLRNPNVIGSSWTFNIPLVQGEAYRWWVRAADSSGDFSAWTPAQDFAVVALATPIQSGPSGPIGGATPTLSWSAVNQADHYDVWVNNLTTGQGQVLRNQDVTGTAWTPGTPLVLGDTYAWWVRAIASSDLGTTSYWSNGQVFSVLPLATPVPAGPTGATPITRPTFSWAAVGQADHYDVWINNLSTGQSQVLRNQDVTGTSWTPFTALTTGDSYAWWVRTAANSGGFSRWSSEQVFSVIPPTTPTGLGASTGTRPTLSWNPVSQADHYDLWVDDLTTHLSQVVRDTNVTGTMWEPSTSLDMGHTYRWWVRAVNNGGGTSGWSAPQTFAVVPSTFTPSTFADGVGIGSLRDAILAANADTGTAPDTIQLQAGTYTLTIQNMSGHETAGLQGDLNITSTSHELIILGAGSSGAGATIIDATSLNDRAFQIVNPGTVVVFENLVIQGGLAQDDGSNGVFPGETNALGGGILNDGGTLTLSNVVIQNNEALASRAHGARGGGVSSTGGAVILTAASQILHNQALGGSTRTADNAPGGAGGAAQGGGIYAANGALTLNGATVSSNRATGGAAGSAFTGHTGPSGGAGQGGGVFYSGPMISITGSTVTGNHATGGKGGRGGHGSIDRPAGPGGAGGTAAGGGIYSGGGSFDLTIASNTAAGGTGGTGGTSLSRTIGGAGGAGGAALGGGLFMSGGTLTFNTTTISGNQVIGGPIGATGSNGSFVAAQFGFITAPQTLTAGVPSGMITVQLQDRFGSPVNAGPGGQIVNLSTDSPGGQFRDLANTTNIMNVSIAAGSSTASFLYQDTLAGTPTLTASASGLTAATQQETVNPSVASQLVITQQPSPTATAGVSFATQPVVAEEDQFGNIITSDSSSTVTAARGSLGTASLQGSNLTIPLSSGVATFSGLFYDKAETMNITFTTNASGVSSATSNAVVVSPAATSTLLVNGFPSPILAGTPGTFTVTATDAFGNRATSYMDTISFSSSDSLASFSPLTYTFQSSDMGVHTFSNGATLNTAGTQSITATDTTNGNITAGTQSGIIVTLIPGTGPAATTTASSSQSTSSLTGTGFTLTLTEGQSFNNTVALFSDSNLADMPSDFTATIDWGDGSSPSFGTITGGNGSFTVAGTHTYTDEGSDPVTVTMMLNSGQATATANSTALVSDGDALTGSATRITVLPGQSFTGTVATFTDTNFSNTSSDFTATIDWGDGSSPDIGTVGGSNGTFTVTGTHTYASAGPFTIAVTLTDDGSGTTSATAHSTTISVTVQGGGIYVASGTLDLTNVTIANNTATGGGAGIGGGGGIGVGAGTLNLANVTIAGNTADPDGSGQGGGVFNSPSGTVNAINTIIATNGASTAPDFSGSFTTAFHNLVGDGTGSNLPPANPDANGNIVGSSRSPINPLLGPLANNGGTTETMALLSGSPAIDAGTSVGAPLTDQIGQLRDGCPDIGAFEFQDFVTIQIPAIVTTAGVSFTFTVTALDASGHIDPCYRGTIAFSSTDPLALLPSAYTFTALDNGVHTFTATFFSVGTQVLTATELTTPR